MGIEFCREVNSLTLLFPNMLDFVDKTITPMTYNTQTVTTEIDCKQFNVVLLCSIKNKNMSINTTTSLTVYSKMLSVASK